MKKSNILPIFFIFAVTALLFFKIFTKGLYPIPADLLVSFYFPWYSGGWEGYNPWTTHKELLSADAIRQIYPWKEFAMDELKSGTIPAWNPYTFSGQPLLANFQSSVFYPLNILYFLTDAPNAWLLLVIAQPLLGGVFMYLCAKSFKLSSVASSFTSVSFIFSSYLITWMENGNIAHSYIWFPAALWAINEFFQDQRRRYAIFLCVSLTLSILGGHPQTAIYLYLTAGIYWLFKTWTSKTKKIISVSTFAAVGLLSLALAAIQLLPMVEFYKNSPISLPFARDVFDRGILPAKNLISFFASDFYGHPANNNFWSFSYGDHTPYFGVVPLMFSLWAIFRFWRNEFTKFAAITSLFFILAATHGPITFLIKTAKIPVLDSTTPSRFVAISIFLLIILSGFGLQDFLKNFGDKKYFKRFIYFLIPITAIYLSFWVFAIFGPVFLQPKEIWEVNLAVTRRNLILPTVMFLAIPTGALAIQIARVRIKVIDTWAKDLLMVGIFAVTLLGSVYYSNKFLPVAPKNFIFPDHLIFNWLKENAGINRFHGSGTAHIDFNFPTHYQVYASEGYDTLRLERYAELLASSFSGKVPESYLRSDGVFPNEENGNRKRLFEILGVKYLLDKEDNPKTGADWHYERFQNDEVKGIWQDGKFQVYERSQVLPRIFLTTKYTVAKNDQEIIEKIYDKSFDLQTVILEKEPSLNIQDNNGEIQIPELVEYNSDKVVVKTNASHNSLLYLSDAHDPNWKVYIDDQETEILRAHYALRSVVVPAGSQTVIFRYEPLSQTLGITISAATALVLAALTLYAHKKRKL